MPNNHLDRFYRLKADGPHRETKRFDPDDPNWLPVHSLIQQERRERERLEARVAQLEAVAP